MNYTVNNGYTLQLPERPHGQKQIREKQRAAKLPDRPKLNVTSIIFAVMLLVLVTKGCIQSAALQTQLGDSLAKVSSTESLLTVAHHDLDAAAATLERSEAERNQQLIAANSASASHTELKQQHLKQLIQFADFVADNPAMATRILLQAEKYALAWGLDTQEIQERKAKIPSMKKVPLGTMVSVVGREDFKTSSILQVAVRDASGNFISGLSRSEFDLMDGGRSIHGLRVEESSVMRGNHSLSALLDTSTSMAGKEFNNLQVGAKQLVRESANPCLVKVTEFSTAVRQISPWSIDAAIHERAIDSLKADGSTSLYQALETNHQDLLQVPEPRSTVLFTDGKDSSGSAPQRVEQIIATYAESQIPVHVLVLDRGDIDEPLLRRLAADTGGSFQKVDSADELQSCFRAVAERLRIPVYRVTALGPIGSDQLSLSVGSLPAVALPNAKLAPTPRH